jgi:hypothetical protein
VCGASDVRDEYYRNKVGKSELGSAASWLCLVLDSREITRTVVIHKRREISLTAEAHNLSSRTLSQGVCSANKCEEIYSNLKCFLQLH